MATIGDASLPQRFKRSMTIVHTLQEKQKAPQVQPLTAKDRRRMKEEAEAERQAETEDAVVASHGVSMTYGKLLCNADRIPLSEQIYLLASVLQFMSCFICGPNFVGNVIVLVRAFWLARDETADDLGLKHVYRKSILFLLIPIVLDMPVMFVLYLVLFSGNTLGIAVPLLLFVNPSRVWGFLLAYVFFRSAEEERRIIRWEARGEKMVVYRSKPVVKVAKKKAQPMKQPQQSGQMGSPAQAKRKPRKAKRNRTSISKSQPKPVEKEEGSGDGGWSVVPGFKEDLEARVNVAMGESSPHHFHKPLPPPAQPKHYDPARPG